MRWPTTRQTCINRTTPVFDNVHMTLMMVAPMAIVVLAVMRSMFPQRRWNWAIIAVAGVVFIGNYIGMRTHSVFSRPTSNAAGGAAHPA